MDPLDWEPLFRLGQVVLTHQAQQRLSVDVVRSALQRHVRGDWGEVGTYDRRAPSPRRLDGYRILSAFQQPDGTRFWIVTTADQDLTVVLLPDEY